MGDGGWGVGAELQFPTPIPHPRRLLDRQWAAKQRAQAGRVGAGERIIRAGGREANAVEENKYQAHGKLGVKLDRGAPAVLIIQSSADSCWWMYLPARSL